MNWEEKKSIILSQINMWTNTHISNKYLFIAKSDMRRKKDPQSKFMNWSEPNDRRFQMRWYCFSSTATYTHTHTSVRPFDSKSCSRIAHTHSPQPSFIKANGLSSFLHNSLSILATALLPTLKFIIIWHYSIYHLNHMHINFIVFASHSPLYQKQALSHSFPQRDEWF